MASFAASRSVFRSSPARSAAARLASQSKSKPTATSSFRISTNTPIFRRLPVEMSCAVETTMPYHTVTASALMTSMLSISQRSCGWLPEGPVKTREDQEARWNDLGLSIFSSV